MHAVGLTELKNKLTTQMETESSKQEENRKRMADEESYYIKLKEVQNIQVTKVRHSCLPVGTIPPRDAWKDTALLIEMICKQLIVRL